MLLPPPPAGALPLLCLPHAGARAAVFRGWADELPSSVQPVPLDYPRGAAGCDSVAGIAAHIQEALAAWPPVLLFGHSLGSLVAYELALALTRVGRPPLVLIVSGHRASQVAPLEPPAHSLPSPDLQAWLARWGGVPPALRQDPATLLAFEPAVREDLRLAETWRAPALKPLPCPIIALAGLSDALAPPASMAPWREHTRHDFRLHALPGSHFFLFEQRAPFLALLALEVERCCA
jgi:surfactin synthase thioesterase subunit